MKRSKVERLAEELTRECRLLSDDGPDPRYVLDRTRLLRLARHVLKRERRARGRTVGYVVVDPRPGGHGFSLVSDSMLPTTRDLDRDAAIGEELARVVLVGRRSK